MKLTNKFALMSVALLTGAASFTACSNDDVLAENPGLSADGESVKTQFALNIPRAGRNARMNAEDVQANGNSGNFRGMKEITLIPVETGTTEVKNWVRKTMITLSDIASATQQSSGSNTPDWTTNTSSVKIYQDVNVPVKTGSFLFYGHAEQGANTAAGDCFKLGTLNSNVATEANVGNIKFNLVAAKGTDTNNQQTAVLTALNGVVTAFGTPQSPSELEALFTALKELKAGSAESVRLTLQALYNKVASATAPQSGGGTESAEYKIKKAIVGDNNNGPFTATENPASSGNYTLAWATANTYPRNINLPDGAAVIAFDAQKNEFSYSDAPVIGGTTNVDAKSIVFPASLYYFANTPVKTSNNTTDNFPTNLQAWNGQEAFKGWKDVVNFDTRKIALQNPINYAVAQLSLQFKCATSTLPAAVKDQGAVTAQTVTVPTDGFPVTGVLVGGQPDAVDYSFSPVASDKFTKTVYDSVIANATPDNVANISAKYDATNYSQPNYTLLLSNKKNVTGPETQATVNFAVEFINNSGTDFRGVNGIIPDGGKFYLIGQLNPTATEGVTKPQGVEAVFEADHQTVVKVNIKTLANAYNTIPDLRSTNLQLGLAVDLEWQKGIQFDVELGGM